MATTNRVIRTVVGAVAACTRAVRVFSSAKVAKVFFHHGFKNLRRRFVQIQRCAYAINAFVRLQLMLSYAFVESGFIFKVK
jgi:hypothetical protein